jgi:hypothetical protein
MLRPMIDAEHKESSLHIMNTRRHQTSASLGQRATAAVASLILAALMLPFGGPAGVSPAAAAVSAQEKGFYLTHAWSTFTASGTLCVAAPVAGFKAGHIPENREGAFYCYNDASTIWTPFLEDDRGAIIRSIFGGDDNAYVAYVPTAEGACNTTRAQKIGRIETNGTVTPIASMARCQGSAIITMAIAFDGYLYLQIWDDDRARGTYSLWAVSISSGSWSLVANTTGLSVGEWPFTTVMDTTLYLTSTSGTIFQLSGTSLLLISSPLWTKGSSRPDFKGMVGDDRYLYPVADFDYFDVGLYRYRWPNTRFDTATNTWVQNGGLGTGFTLDRALAENGYVYLRDGVYSTRIVNLATGEANSYSTYPLQPAWQAVHRGQLLSFYGEPSQSRFAAAQSLTITAPTSTVYGESPISVSVSSTSGLTPALSVSPADVCTSSGLLISIVGGGNCVLTFSQGGDSFYFSAPILTRVLVVDPATQSIAWTAPASATVGTNVLLSGTSSSGRFVNYASLTPNTCGIAGSSLVPLLRGVCRVRATVSATASYQAATPVVADIDINPATQALGITAPSSIGFGESVTISAQTTSGDPAEWTVLTPDICAMDGNVVTALATGDCTVSASIDASDGYSAASSEATIVVEKGDQAITFPALPSGLAPGHPITLNATASSGIAVAFQASGACSVGTSSGVTTLTPVGTSGSCTVVARQVGDDNWNAAVPVTRVTTVRKLGQTILFSLTSASRLPSAAPFALAASSTSGLSVAFAARGVCAVSAGTVTLTGSTGVCTVTASQAGDSGYRPAVSVSRSFNVAQASQTIDTSGVEVEWTAPGSTPLPSLSTAGLATSWVSSTEEICVPDYDSDTQSWSAYFVDAGSCELVGSAAGNTDYMAATPVSVTIDVTAAAGIGIPGVTVDDGAEYTNELGVTVSLINVPDGTVAVAIGNDGDPTKATQMSLDGFVLDGDRYLVPWRLQPTTLDGKLAKTVYVWFLGSDYEAIPYQDGIILDTTAPALTSAVVAKTTGTGPVLGTGANATYGVTLRASDFGSGLAYVQVVTSKTAATKWVGYIAKTKWRGKKGLTVYVRVKDVAGNVSAWKTVKLP